MKWAEISLHQHQKVAKNAVEVIKTKNTKNKIKIKTCKVLSIVWRKEKAKWKKNRMPMSSYERSTQ